MRSHPVAAAVVVAVLALGAALGVARPAREPPPPDAGGPSAAAPEPAPPSGPASPRDPAASPDGTVTPPTRAPDAPPVPRAEGGQTPRAEGGQTPRAGGGQSSDAEGGQAPTGGGPTPQVADRTPEPAHPELAQQVRRLLARPDLAVEGTVGLALATGDGRPVLSVRADHPLIPASAQKLVPAAAALETWGATHRFVTRVVAYRPPTGSGTIVGDLVLDGAGDPLLATEEYAEFVYPDRPRTPIEALADAVVAAGVDHVTGAVVADASAFGGVPVAAGWKPSYLRDLDARRIAAATVDAGLRTVVQRPAPGEVRAASTLALDPAMRTAHVLRRELVERGVVVQGGARATRTPTTAADEVAGIASPPLGRLVTHLLQRSDNHAADTLFRAVGAARREPATWTVAASAIRDLLTRGPLGMATAGIELARWEDGSGLSRRNRSSARLLVALDVAMTSSEHGPVWQRSLARTGRSGTLRGRLTGTIAEGRFRGKTGTLVDVRSLIGSAAGRGGDRLHLAIIGNGLRGEDALRIRALMDEVVMALVAHLDGCRLVTPRPEPVEGDAHPDPVRSTTVCPAG